MSQDPIVLQALRASAEDLARELDRLPEAAATWRPKEGEWSQHECLTHIWICDRSIFLPRMQAIAGQDNPHLPMVDERALMRAEWNADRPRADLLKEFAAIRAEEIALLEKTDWARPGVHAARGPISMGWVANYALAHTLEHLSQMMRARMDYETRARNG